MTGATLSAPRRLVGVFGEALITIGVLVLLFVSWQLWWTDLTANRDQAGTISALERGFGQARSDPGVGQSDVAGQDSLATLKSAPFGEAFAILRIPRFGSNYARPVLQGTDRDTLIRGVGHYAETAMPGVVGNFAVAGHRTTYGRPFHDIDLLKKGDVIVVETRTSYVVYAVSRQVIVTPDRVEVLYPVPERPGAKPVRALMTMTACEPKYSARERYVVFAELVKTIPRAEGLTASFMAVPSGSVA